MNNFFRNFVEDLKDEDTSIAADGQSAGEFTGTIDTGSYMLNALLSGSLYGGVPNNKVTAFAGESATGKTFFVLGIIKAFLDNNPDAGVMYYDTEAAVTRKMMEERGIDVDRVMISEPQTIQEFRTKALKAIELYETTPKDKRPPFMFVLDSLGLLSTTKELEDIAEGKETRDMTKAQVIKAAFRVLTLKLAKAGIPMLVTNHVYEVIGSYIPMKEMGGGTGLKYAASTIVYLGKKKERDATTKEIVGNIIKCTTYKSRLSKENATAEVLLSYDKGLDKYYGLIEMAIDAGIFEKKGSRIDAGGKSVYAKNILSNPEDYFTDEVMASLEEYAQRKYSYGKASGSEMASEDISSEVSS
jgi:RecA/RadA recombinase